MHSYTGTTTGGPSRRGPTQDALKSLFFGQPVEAAFSPPDIDQMSLV
jgi:hypothetical protein